MVLVMVMVDTIVHTAMGTIVLTATDTGEGRRGMLSQLLPLTQMLKLLLMPTMVTMVLAMVMVG